MIYKGAFSIWATECFGLKHKRENIVIASLSDGVYWDSGDDSITEAAPVTH